MNITPEMQKAGLDAYELIRCSPHINTPDRVVNDVFVAMIAAAPAASPEPAPEAAPPADNEHVAEGASLFTEAVDAVEHGAESLVEKVEDALGLLAHDGAATSAPAPTPAETNAEQKSGDA